MQCIDEFPVTACDNDGDYSAFASDFGWTAVTPWPVTLMFRGTVLRRQYMRHTGDAYMDNFVSDDETICLTVFDD